MSAAPIGILVRFPRPFGEDGASARAAHVGAADGYPGMPGLVFTAFLSDVADGSLSVFAVWDSADSADDFYASGEWAEHVAAIGSVPTFRRFDVGALVLLDGLLSADDAVALAR
jgi:hypothetical protein